VHFQKLWLLFGLGIQIVLEFVTFRRTDRRRRFRFLVLSYVAIVWFCCLNWKVKGMVPSPLQQVERPAIVSNQACRRRTTCTINGGSPCPDRAHVKHRPSKTTRCSSSSGTSSRSGFPNQQFDQTS
jgi:hypothetical protein